MRVSNTSRRTIWLGYRSVYLTLLSCEARERCAVPIRGLS